MLDLSALWSFYQQHKNRAGTLIIGLLLFAAGFQVGKVTSPYYAAHPIVFEDRHCETCSSSGGTTAELQELKEQGIEQREKEKTPNTVATDPVVPPAAVAGTTITNDNSPPATEQKFVGSVNSDLYHDPTCSSAKRIKPANQIWFASPEEATAAGYSPSKCTQEKLGL